MAFFDPLSEKKLLRDVVATLAASMRKQDFLTYFKKLSIVEHTKDRIVYGVVSSFMRDNLEQKFSNEMYAATIACAPEITGITFVVDTMIENTTNTQVVDCQELYKQTTAKKKRTEIPGHEQVDGIVSRIMNEKYRLDNFVIGPSNQLAYAAADAVSRRPGASYNPLFIYGDVGLGKTHLLQAIGNGVRMRLKDKRVIYTTADRFLTDYVSHVKTRKVDRMREKYRAIDVLIIDDVQFLANKKQTQEELYNIFNILYEANKQIVLS